MVVQVQPQERSASTGPGTDLVFLLLLLRRGSGLVSPSHDLGCVHFGELFEEWGSDRTLTDGAAQCRLHGIMEQRAEHGVRLRSDAGRNGVGFACSHRKANKPSHTSRRGAS